MTKKEQAEMDALKEELRLLRALRFTERVDPDLPIPTEGTTTGFLFNAYSVRVDYAVSMTSVHTSSYQPIDKDRRGSWSQGGKAIYSTREKALRAMRHEMERDFAKKLASVDAQIEKETVAA